MRKCIHSLTLCLVLCLVLLFILHFFTGCDDSASNRADEYLIRLGDKVVTVLDFNNAFEIVKTAYPRDFEQNTDELLNARLRLLNQMVVEVLMLKRAEELGITLSETEFEEEVAEIKADYPDGTFEETLLEFAVSYESWENRLKTRMIMDKVIEKDLNEQITITPADITEFYQNNYKALESNLSENENSHDINEVIILRLRRQKAEKAYKDWINKLSEQYPIEINSTLWEEMTGMKRFSIDDLNPEKP